MVTFSVGIKQWQSEFLYAFMCSWYVSSECHTSQCTLTDVACCMCLCTDHSCNSDIISGKLWYSIWSKDCGTYTHWVCIDIVYCLSFFHQLYVQHAVSHNCPVISLYLTDSHATPESSARCLCNLIHETLIQQCRVVVRMTMQVHRTNWELTQSSCYNPYQLSSACD